MSRPYEPGDRVRLYRLPPWVGDLPEESRAVFRFCVGRPYKIQEVDAKGLLVLDVSADIDPRFGGEFNDIRVEPEHVRPAER